MIRDLPRESNTAPPPNRRQSRRIASKSAAMVAASGVLAMGLVAGASAPASAAGTDVPLNTPYVISAEFLNKFGQLYRADPNGATFSTVGGEVPHLGGLAGRVSDRRLYAFQNGAGADVGKLVQIDGDGTVTPIGIVPGVYVTATPGNFEYVLGGTFGTGPDAEKMFDFGLAQLVNDRVTVLYYGKVLATGTPDEIQANARVREVYLGARH